MFRTYEPTRDRLVAVKVFRLDITPEQSRALADELARGAEAGLFHPSIVEPIAAGVQGTVAYRAEEYVAAESLDVAMRQYSPASIEKVLPFVTQLAGAIDFARAAGVGHGALHPRDIFITPDEVRATGFGVVDALERVGLRAPVRRPYSPPERVAGEAWSTSADVFTLAVIAFELLTGRRPSGTGDEMGSLAGAATGNHPDQVRNVVARAMDDDPGGRFPNALAFVAALEAAARGEGDTVTTAPPRADEPPTRVIPTPEAVAETARAEAAGLDDITAEREEDEAHWALSEQEKRAAAETETPEPPAPFDDKEVEAAADRLTLDAADLALTGEAAERQFGDVFREPPVETAHAEPVPRDPRLDSGGAASSRPMPTVPRVPPPPPTGRKSSVTQPTFSQSSPIDDAVVSDESRGLENQPRSERSRTAVLPLAVMLTSGLLLGFAAGYAVGARGAAPPVGTLGDAGSTSAAPPKAAADSPPPKPFGTANTPSPKPPATADKPTAKPPATAPAVPPEAPPEAAERPRATPESRRTGRLVVRSTPSGASVTVNGEWRGTTPLTLDQLALGDYVVRVVQPGYETAREAFSLSAEQSSRTVSARLRRVADTAPQQRTAPAERSPSTRTPGSSSRYTGSIFVDSRPRGAQVFIDGKAVGTTPLRIPELSIGAHVVRLELPDHSTWTGSVRVTADQQARVSGSLEKIR